MSPGKPIAARVYSFLNAAVALTVLVGVFTAVNWHQMPGGITAFLAMRITMKNLLMVALFLVTCIIAFRAFGLSKPSPSVPFWKELWQVTKGCTVITIFALLFPLTSTGAFTHLVLLYFLPTAIIACLSGKFRRPRARR